MRKLKWSCRCLAVVSVLWAAGIACGQGTPPDKALSGTVLDKAPQGVLLLAVVKDISATDVKLGDLVAQLMPQMMPGGDGGAAPKMEPLKMLMAKMTGKPDLVKAGSPLIFLLSMDQENIEAKPLMAILVDVADIKGLVGEAQPDAAGIYEFELNGHNACAPYQGLVLISDSKAEVQAFMKMPAGVKLTAAQDELWKNADAFAMINLAQLVKTYTPTFEKKRAVMQAAVEAAATKETPDPQAKEQAAKAQAMVKLMDDLWAYAAQADWAALGVTADKGGVDLKMALGVKPGGKLANYLADHPPLAKELTPGLPALDAWAVGWYSFEPQKVSTAMTDMFDLARTAIQLVPADAAKPEGLSPAKLADLLKQVEDLAKAQMETVGGQGASAAIFDKSGSIIHSVTVMKVKDPAACRQNMEAQAKVMKSLFASLMALLPTGGMKIEMDMTYEKDVQKLGDLSLDRSVLKIKLPGAAKKPAAEGAEAPPPANPASEMGNKMMAAMWGGDVLTTWYAFSDGYVFAEVGPAPEHLAEMVKAAKAGGGLAADPDLAALRQHTLADSNLVAFVSLSSYLNTMMGAVMGALGQPAPPVNPDLVKMKSAFSLAAGHGRLVGELYMPVGEMKMITVNFMTMFMQMQQIQMQKQMQMQKQPLLPQMERQNNKVEEKGAEGSM
jgi:hypothetical protein